MTYGDCGGAPRGSTPGGRPATVLLATALLTTACRAAADPSDPVDLLYAGSLAAVMEDALAPAFREASGRAVRGEPHGSLAAANQIRDGVRDPDLYLTSDPGTLRLLGPREPGWAVAFAAGELVVGYAAGSRFAPALDSAAAGRLSWAGVLSRPGLRLGRTDPALDPKGYRTLWLLEVAGEEVGSPELASRLLSAPGTVFPEPHLPARVESGSLDAGVFYLAEARAHGLRVVRLPAEANQADPDRATEYARHRYVTPEGVEIRGSPIVYAATVPRGAPDGEAGADFLDFLLAPAGRGALEQAGLPPLARILGDPDRVPSRLRAAAHRASGP